MDETPLLADKFPELFVFNHGDSYNTLQGIKVE